MFTLAVAFAQDVTQFTALRFLAGLGLGACLPTALAYMSEHAPKGSNSKAVTRTMTGYHVGAVLTALLALWLVEDFGWESMFVVGGVLGLLTLPLMWAKLPESEAYLAAVSDEHAAPGPADRRRRAAAVPAGQHRPLGRVVHGAAAGLRAQHLAAQDHGRGRLLHPGGHDPPAGARTSARCSGLLVAGVLADARGNKQIVLLWFGLAAAFLALLEHQARGDLARVRRGAAHRHLRVQRAGAGVRVRRPPLPAAVRGTALGMAAGVGRVGAIVGPSIGGALVTAGIAYPWGFYAFAIAAVLAMVALATVPADAGRFR